MRKLFATASFVALMLLASHAEAASTLAIGASGGFNNGSAVTAAQSNGLGVAAAGAVGVSAGTSAGIGVATPLGGLSAGISQTNNLGAARGFSAGILGGGGATLSNGNGTGINGGAGFTNVTP